MRRCPIACAFQFCGAKSFTCGYARQLPADLLWVATPCAWATDLFQLQLYFLPSLLLNWSWLCLALERSPPGPWNICYISCMFSCVLTRNIKIRNGRRQGEGGVQWNSMNANRLACLFVSLNLCPLLPGPTDFLPADSSSLETNYLFRFKKTVITYRPLQTEEQKQNNKWSPLLILCSLCHMHF